MPRITDEIPLNIPRSSRRVVPVARRDFSGLSNIGSTAQSIGQDIRDRQDAFSAATQQSALLLKQNEIISNLKQDPDYATHGDKYEAAMRAAREESAGLIRSGRHREAFGLDSDRMISAGREIVRVNVRSKERDNNRAVLKSQTLEHEEAASMAEDSTPHLNQIYRMHEAAYNSGDISKEEQLSQTRAAAENYAVGKLKRQDPNTRLVNLKDYKNNDAKYIPIDIRVAMEEQAKHEIAWQRSAALAAEKAERNAIALDLSNQLQGDEGGTQRPVGYYDLDPAQLARLTLAQKKALQDYDKIIREGREVITDWPTKSFLMTMASQNPERFSKVELTEFTNRLSKDDMEEMKKAQLAYDPNDKVLKGIRTEKSVLDSTLKGLGLDDASSETDIKKAELFGREFDRLLILEKAERQESGEATDLTILEVQAIADRLAAEVSSSWYQSDIYAYQLGPDDEVELDEDYELTEAARAESIFYLEQAGIPVTEGAIREFYRSSIEEDRAR